MDAFIGGTPSSPVKQWQERFSSDSLGHLDIASEYRGDNNQLTGRADYDYDQYGNRLQLPTRQSQNLNIAYTTIQSTDINATTNRFTSGINYDPAGNITQDTKFHNQQYAYDANGRVKTSNPVGGAQATATYDGLGQIVRTQVGGTTQTLIYDIYGRVAAEIQNGSLQK
jgi:YD repeat-containing protein